MVEDNKKPDKRTVHILQNVENEELHEKQLIHAMTGYGDIIIWTVDPTKTVTYYNNGFVSYIGGIVISDTITLYEDDILHRAPAGKLWNAIYEQAFRGKNSHLIMGLPDDRWIKIWVVPIRTDGKITALAGWGSEVTEEIVARLSLRKSEQKFRNIFESLQDVYFRCRLNGELETVSPSIEKIAGYWPEELQGKDIANYYLYSVTSKSLLRRLIKVKELKNVEISIIHRIGKIIPSLCSLKLVKEENGLFVEGILRDIAEIKQTNEELEHAMELAEASLQIKEKFLANMSHEIRTPLNGIIGMVDVLGNTKLTDEQHGQVEAIRKSSDVLLKLLNNILDWSKIEAGRVALEMSPVSIRDLLDEVILIYSQKAIDKNIKVSKHIAPNIPDYILTDEVKLIQIFSNLLSNSLKFTSRDGEVNIIISVLASINGRLKLKCEVRDTGIGISDIEKSRIFKSFTQLDSSENKKHHGAGLGLSISKELVQLLGGEINVESTPGKGSIFWFTIKCDTAAAESKSRVIRVEKLMHAPKVLIVDDNKINQDVAAGILTHAGAEVDKARSGEEAMQLLSKKSYSVVLLDIQMPEMSGLEVIAKIHDEIKDIPSVIALTAYSSASEKSKFLSVGFNDFLGKPIVPEELIRKVEEWSNAQVAIVDDVIQQKLISFGGTKMLKEAMDDFYEETEKQIKECFVSLSDNNHKRILDILHAIKGNAGTLGVNKVAKSARQIEQQLKKGYISKLEGELKELEHFFKEFKTHYFEQQ